MRRIVVALTVAVVVPLAAPVQASHVNVADGEDSRGPLDVRRVVPSGGAYAKWRIDSYTRWSRRMIWDRGYLMVYLDTFGTKRHDYYALIWADKRRLRATLVRDRREKSDIAVRPLPLGRPSPRSVRVTVGLKNLKLGKDRATYNWYLQTLWTGAECRRVCFDWAPDIGKRGDGIDEPLPLRL